MDRRRAFIVAAIFFLISMLLVSGYVSIKESELTKAYGEEVTVVIAKEYIPAYSIIKPSMVALSSSVGKKVFRAYRQPSAAQRIDDVIGKSVFVPILQGEQVTFTKLMHLDGRPVLDKQVETNFRAVTVVVTPFNAVGRLIRPGNRIDVLAVPQYDAKGSQTWEVKTIAQNILVLATGRNIQNEVPSRVSPQDLNKIETQILAEGRRDVYAARDALVTSKADDNYKNLTLMLPTDKAQQILYLISKFGDGVLHFTLRNSADNATVPVKTTLLDDVLGPQSDYARSRTPAPPTPVQQPEFFDSVGGEARPVYPN